MLIRTFRYSFLVYVCLHLSCIFSFLLDMYLRVELLGYMRSLRGFPGGSDGKESACNTGPPGSIPGEGNGYPHQYSGLENSMDRGAWQATAHGVAKSQKGLSDFHFHSCLE